MNKRSLQRRYKNNQQAQKKMPNTIIREIQSKTTGDAISHSLVQFKLWQLSGEFRKAHTLLAQDGTVKWCNHYETICKFLKNLKIHLPYDLEIPLRDMYREGLKAGTETDICVP